MEEKMDLENKRVLANVFDINIYDENGEFVTLIDTASETLIYTDKKGDGFVEIKNPILDEKLLRFQNDQLQKPTSDYDALVSKTVRTPIDIKAGKREVKCKLVGKTKVENAYDGKISEALVIIPLAVIGNGAQFMCKYGTAAGFPLVFRIIPEGDSLFSIVNLQ